MLIAIVDQMPCAEVTAVMKRTIMPDVSEGTCSRVDREARTESIEALQGRRSPHDLARAVSSLVDTPAHHGDSNHRKSHGLDEDERAKATRVNEDHRELEEPLQRRSCQNLPALVRSPECVAYEEEEAQHL